MLIFPLSNCILLISTFISANIIVWANLTHNETLLGIFSGTIKEIENGAVNAIVKLDIGGGNIISATISMDAVKSLNLAVGKEAYAVIKSTSVMVGVE